MKLLSLFVAACGAASVSAQVVVPSTVASTDPPLSTVSCNVDHCEACSVANICSSCGSGYSADHSINTDGTCTPCTLDNCALCDESPDSCSECVSGYQVVTAADGSDASATDSCVACSIFNCGDCTTLADAETCNACKDGFYLLQGSCAACGNQCAECASVDAGGNAGGCLLCNSGYEAEIDGTCALIGTDCGSHCLACEEHNDCKSCEDGYSVMLFNNGQSTGCDKCPTNCASCSDSSNCETCEDGYTLDEVSGSCATQAQIYANVCDCRTTVNGGCTCAGDEATAKDKCCDQGSYCGAAKGGVCATYSAGCTAFENCAYCFGQSFCGSCDVGYYKQEGRAFGDCIALPVGWDLTACAVATLYDTQCTCGCGGVDPECVEHTVENCAGDQVYCDASGECANCLIEGCAFCANGADGASECSVCMDGYDLNDGKTCTKCDIDGCASCMTSFFYNADTDTAEETTFCRTCLSGYAENIISGTCSRCTIENCEMCNGGTCNNCLDGFSLQTDGTCKSCGANCLQCGQTQCNRCASGYEIKDGACGLAGADCGTNCAVCQRGGQCKICSAGFYVGAGTNGKCVACIANCGSCRDGQSCTTCKDGYAYDIDEFQCLGAGDCLADVCDCRSSTNNGCTCLEDESKAKLGCCNDDCGKCSDHCVDYKNEPCTAFANCEYCYGQTYCMECKTGFYQPEYHGDCVALPSGWDIDTCPLSYLNNNQCDCGCGGYDAECDDYAADGCASGQYCSTAGTCTTCSLAGCAHCSNGEGHVDGSCLECTDGHYQDSSGQCLNCELTGCKECLAAPGNNDDTEFSCKECTSDYFMTNTGTCSKCTVTNCATCDPSGGCEECADGYSVSTTGSCNACPSHCLDCQGDTSTCKRCADNYEVGTTGTCGLTGNDCGNNCNVCGAQGICKLCLPGYYKSTSGVCTACIANCASCTNAASCNSCMEGHGYVSVTKSCDPYTDPVEYCSAEIAAGRLSLGSVCNCSGWQCAEASSRTLRLRRE